jgi:hypothetical protein
MTFGKWIEQQTTGAPEETAIDIRLGLAGLGIKDREIDSLTLKEVRDVARVLNVPAEDLGGILLERRCRACGCTDDDCHQCIERTGTACHWIEEDLCSACLPIEKGGPVR